MVDIIESLKTEIEKIDKKILELYAMNPIFGFISAKYVKCGKKNCKCNYDSKYRHGPYYYLRQEPEYKYMHYLGKKIPLDIKRRLDIGKSIKKLERKKLQIQHLLEQINC
ncbi:MAG: DUF6788 family protein [Candidatus Heimdallarchaeaceae archaeon]